MEISCDAEEQSEKWLECLKHLETGASEVDLKYTVVREGEGWAVANATEEATGLAEGEVLPSLLTMLFGDLCAALSQYLLLHAAVAVKADRLLMFPGESAFGKSTLSAALASSGWSLYSDELAPLDTEKLEVAPFVMPVGIKSRSLPVLKTFYPDLEKLTAWQRLDGHVVRYLAPPHINLADSMNPPKPIDVLIFPRFIPGVKTAFEQLTPLQALELLANTGSSERALEPKDVQALLTLAEEKPCWSLTYSNLEEAVAAVDTVVRGG